MEETDNSGTRSSGDNREVDLPAATVSTAPQKPPFENYADWFLQVFGVDLSSTGVERFYRVNSMNARREVEESIFFRHIRSVVAHACEDYKNEYGSELLMNPIGEIVFDVKKFSSVVEKSYRINIVENSNFPDAPDNGWVTPESWFNQLNDIIRCRIICKFMDGLHFLTEYLTGLAETHKLRCLQKSHEKEGGYYAFHFYVWIPVGLLSFADGAAIPFDTELQVEIQLTTQLQEILYDLTHEIYEGERKSLKAMEPKKLKWQWDYSSPRFKPGYMGHTLHMLEAFILEVRDQQLEGRKRVR